MMHFAVMKAVVHKSQIQGHHGDQILYGRILRWPIDVWKICAPCIEVSQLF
jgi:hypothetical protein